MNEPQARDNGLSAESYAPLADLHPQVAGEMLDALRDAGIAAYAAPSPSDDLIDSMVAEGGLDPGTAADRLYVDAAMRPRAEQVLMDRLPPSSPIDADGDREGDPAPERDEDAIWAEIVASYDAETATGHDAATPWPEEENVPASTDDERDERDGDDGQDRSGRLPTARVIKPADDELPDEDEMFEDDGDEGHFVPPPPPPLPSPDPTTKAAWIALFGGPLYLLAAAILNWQVPGWAAFLAVAAFVGGFVALVLRMGDDPRDPDDGAVV